ncbi:uncharacterized protein LOC135212503 [Macrobrachium nipponense]|uniref:uncharacterized protein LOC135212503 n=1 Tax=Macrobrachium nipponense TaxID=159736 RepID=UPI0030C7EBED
MVVSDEDDGFSDGLNHTMSERERLDHSEHVLNLTVALLILTIFTFFFVIIIVILCFQWMEKRNTEQKGCLLLPSGSLPGYITIMSSDHPHMRLLGHYQFQTFRSKDKWTLGQSQYSSSPYLLSPNDITEKEKRRSY